MSASTRFEKQRPFAHHVFKLQDAAGEQPIIGHYVAGFSIAYALLDLSEAAREIATEIRKTREGDGQ